MTQFERPLIIYHGNCPDGAGAAAIAWLHFGDDAEYLPAFYSDPCPFDRATGRKVYVLDFSYGRADTEKLAGVANGLVILDHHKTHEEATAKALVGAQAVV